MLFRRRSGGSLVKFSRGWKIIAFLIAQGGAKMHNYLLLGAKSWYAPRHVCYPPLPPVGEETLGRRGPLKALGVFENRFF